MLGAQVNSKTLSSHAVEWEVKENKTMEKLGVV